MTTQRAAASKWRSIHILGFLFLLAGAEPSYSATVGDAGEFIADLGTHAIQIMQDSGSSVADRQQRFQTLMNADFDLPKIAQTVLGRYWQGTSDIERQQFTDAFADYMSQMYFARFSDYNAGSFRVLKQRVDSERMMVVSTEIVPLATGQPIRVDWNVVRTVDSYKVVDIVASGASLSQALREEFSTVIRRSGGVTNLVELLKTKVSELTASTQ
ncbi:ABC transporter substrate-binding protein [Telmatospirillum sp.]|uniref:MlaC/ttg2D family ABC transporter substrate-binding protein n=1 Tax=Telmatospirillum sp. TaxID=2079197 RepID=UPI00284A530D|nr:ABC transporter substrate-binding protein [Telmatospirillum sp.]MDR3440536.1 ABC transporter substrate-binding protein [Telmatospirillum sp.]